MKDFEIRCDESRLETTNLIYGKFTLGPFLPGQATTFGNALRRSLLAELSGLAITAFEIIGVMQEFSTLPGLRESILDLSLNLKQIVLTGVLPHSTPPIGFLNVRGPAIIKAVDLKLPAGVYCTSPTQYIATLGSNGMLHLKFVVSVGKGYSIQPYSIYRSLSKVKLQPASNFDKAIFDQKLSITRPAQSEDIDEFLKRSNKSTSTTTPVFQPQYNKETSSFERPSSLINSLANSKGLYMQSKEGVATDPVGVKLRKPVGAPDTNTQSKVTGSSASQLRKPVEVKALPLAEGVKTFQDTPNKEGLTRFTKQRGQEQALSYKASPSTFFTPEDVLKKNSNSSYINIQTQLFQRITPHQVLPIDAVFTPVSQVNFLTEVNDRFETARENIVLEIWTNGSIHPKRALEEATLSLVQNFDTLLKKIQQASSFYKGLRYWTYLQPFKSSLREKTDEYLEEGFNYPATDPVGVKLRKPLPLQDELRTQSVALQGVKAVHDQERERGMVRLEEEPRNLYESFEEKSLEKLFKKELPQSIYNLDIGNLNLSLQTFLFLKKAKIHTLLQLLTQFSLKQNNQLRKPVRSHLEFHFINEKILEELNDVIRQFGSEN